MKTCGRGLSVLAQACLAAWIAFCTLATGQDSTATVKSGKEFLEAIRSGNAASIIITNHLDLRKLEPDRVSSKESPGVASIVRQHQISIQVLLISALPTLAECALR
jgi:hypothetical protein